MPHIGSMPNMLGASKRFFPWQDDDDLDEGYGMGTSSLRPPTLVLKASYTSSLRPHTLVAWMTTILTRATAWVPPPLSLSPSLSLSLSISLSLARSPLSLALSPLSLLSLTHTQHTHTPAPQTPARQSRVPFVALSSSCTKCLLRLFFFPLKIYRDRSVGKDGQAPPTRKGAARETRKGKKKRKNQSQPRITLARRSHNRSPLVSIYVSVYCHREKKENGNVRQSTRPSARRCYRRSPLFLLVPFA